MRYKTEQKLNLKNLSALWIFALLMVFESGKGPENKFKARYTWVKLFIKRKWLSVQVKIEKKHRPTAELLPRMNNFH